MKRELTPDEEAYVDRALRLRSRQSPRSNKSSGGARKSRPAWTRLSYWSIFILLIACAINGFFMLFIYQYRALVGDETIRFVIENKDSPELEETVKNVNLDWVQEYLKFYENRFLIMGAVFSVAILIIAVMLVVDNIIDQRYMEKEQND